MKITFANEQTSAPFHYATWVKTRYDANQLLHKGTLFIGEPRVGLGVLLELRLKNGTWAADPIVSGGNLTNRTNESVFIAVEDHANATEFLVNLGPANEASRIGTPIIMECIVTKGGTRLHYEEIVLGYIGGMTTVGVPFFCPPTNPQQQTILYLNNFQNENNVRFIATDSNGKVWSGLYPRALKKGEQVLVVADELYRIVGANPVAGNNLRLIICASAPLTVVAKVRNSKNGNIAENASYIL